MNIRNSTNKQLTIYIGSDHDETPDVAKTLRSGEGFNVDSSLVNVISIQEN